MLRKCLAMTGQNQLTQVWLPNETEYSCCHFVARNIPYYIIRTANLGLGHLVHCENSTKTPPPPLGTHVSRK